MLLGVGGNGWMLRRVVGSFFNPGERSDFGGMLILDE